MKKHSWIAISGLSWLFIGLMLLIKGLKFIIEALDKTTPIIQYFTSIVGSKEKGALLLISVAVFVGLIKGATLLGKTVHRISARIAAVEGTIPFTDAYDRKYFFTLGAMVGIGFLFRFIPIAHDIRGGIDVAIGTALITGSWLYFRKLFQ